MKKSQKWKIKVKKLILGRGKKGNPSRRKTKDDEDRHDY